MQLLGHVVDAMMISVKISEDEDFTEEFIDEDDEEYDDIEA